MTTTTTTTTKDELRRLLRATSGWRTAILCGRTRPARALVRQFVWGPPLIGCTADQTRSAGARESCILKTGTQIAGDVLSGENIRTAAKRRTKTAGRDLLQSLLATSPSKRVKRAAPQRDSRQRRPVKRAARRRRIAEADVFFLAWRSSTGNCARE